MGTRFLAFWLLCLLAGTARSKPQITKLFPVQEPVEYPQRPSNETKPLDRLLGKLRATYDFVFRKPENASNVEKIRLKEASDPDVDALKTIWSNRMPEENSVKKIEVPEKPRHEHVFRLMNDDWANDIQPLDQLEPLGPLEFEDEEGDKKTEVEFITPKPSLQFPVTISRHLVDWLGSLLGITYGVYSKLARAIYTNTTASNN
ncbi:uncharacterized protein LOC143215906 isoform X2 [Lasioglossum baleicum]|uniref:uncharacterized protein LOC143215906 isoform X2 n=1 Tax=Lasioglossum baleicum TaxID=434251 RepID=UPI003FCD59EC